VTAPMPAPRLSPMAGFVDALRRRYIQLAPGYIAVLEAAVAAETERNHELTTARDFAASVAAGYIDRTGLERP
jgi:hypothetical protein